MAVRPRTRRPGGDHADHVTGQTVEVTAVVIGHRRTVPGKTTTRPERGPSLAYQPAGCDPGYARV